MVWWLPPRQNILEPPSSPSPIGWWVWTLMMRVCTHAEWSSAMAPQWNEIYHNHWMSWVCTCMYVYTMLSWKHHRVCIWHHLFLHTCCHVSEINRKIVCWNYFTNLFWCMEHTFSFNFWASPDPSFPVRDTERTGVGWIWLARLGYSGLLTISSFLPWSSSLFHVLHRSFQYTSPSTAVRSPPL